MASPELDPNPLIPPPQPHQLIHHPSNYVVLPLYYPHTPWWAPRRRPRRWKSLYISSLLILAALATAAYTTWPSDPDLKIVRLRLLHVKFHTRPHLAVDISLAATVKLENMDWYSMDYSSLDVAVGYRGKVLGHVTSGGGHVKARGSSYVDATLDFNGVKVIADWMHMVHDLAKGMIQFDTVTQVDGLFGFFLFEIPLKAKISCEIDVNTKNQTVSHQNCYPE